MDDEIEKIKGEIETLRLNLVHFAAHSGDLLQEDVLYLSRQLDELIIRYYRLMKVKESGAKIA
jgi:hypothetical protein